MGQESESFSSETAIAMKMTHRIFSENIKLMVSLALIVWPSLLVFPQAENKLIRQGNRQYHDENYKEAEIEYRKSLDKNEASVAGRYNLGTSLYRQKNHQEAILSFDSVLKAYPNDKIRSQSYYNLGNSLLKFSQDSAGAQSNALQGSIEAYKQALRLNPGDSAARYNLAYAQRLLQKQQQQQGQGQQDQQNQDQQGQQDQQQNQQQNQQQQDQQQNQQQQDQQQDQQQEQQREQQREQQAQPREISKQDAERMLEAMKNDEKNTLEKLRKQQVSSQRVTIEKDW